MNLILVVLERGHQGDRRTLARNPELPNLIDKVEHDCDPAHHDGGTEGPASVRGDRLGDVLSRLRRPAS